MTSFAADRIRCVIPFCKRTAPRERVPEGHEIICGKCWRRADPKLRKLQRRARRRWDKTKSERDAVRIDRLWAKIIAQAIERAGDPSPKPAKRRTALAKPKRAPNGKSAQKWGHDS